MWKNKTKKLGEQARRNSTGRCQEFDKKKRTRINTIQLKILKDFFKENSLPNNIEREKLANRLEINERSIQIWFQNQRAKTKFLLEEKKYKKQVFKKTPKKYSKKKNYSKNKTCFYTDLPLLQSPNSEEEYLDILKSQNETCFWSSMLGGFCNSKNRNSQKKKQCSGNSISWEEK